MAATVTHTPSQKVWNGTFLNRFRHEKREDKL